ncbi:hypothetical protein AB836_01830 [Rickettsiales bacterium (ex Bugula neritina AB1)]|nr:hypothetical protein AB836_01830 [Rickettsiales bacterium (ex Bugula neritina AB1)]
MKTILKRIRKHNRETRRIKSVNHRNQQLPRMCIRKTSKHIYVTIVDDLKSITLLALSSLNSNMINKGVKGYNINGSKIIGEEFAKMAIKNNITKVVIDKGGKSYHGLIKALLEKFFETLEGNE